MRSARAAGVARALVVASFAAAPLAARAAGEQRTVTPQVRMPVPYEAVQALPRRAPDRMVTYGGEPSQRISVWHADADPLAPAPVVVLLHGGCWLSAYGVDGVEPLATALAAEGFAVWAPEYRRLGEPGGGWPGTFEDVAAAIDLLERSDDPALDAGRVVLVGHSAGGHLALWAAARAAFAADHPLLEPSPLVPRGAIGLAAITDLAAYAALPGGCPQAAVQLMGGAPEDEPEAYGWASPASLPRPVPVVLLQGSADPIVPASQARAMPNASVRLAEGAGHFDWLHPKAPTFAMLLEELGRLLGDAPALPARD